MMGDDNTLRGKVIPKDKMESFFEVLSVQGSVFAPSQKEGVYQFSKVSSLNSASLDYPNTRRAPKELLFPPGEPLFLYNHKENGIEVKDLALQEGEKKILLGIRPCDAKSFLLLDQVFLSDDCQDIYYRNKREKLLIITLGCDHPWSTCFCSSLSLGPFNREGADLFLTDINTGYVIEGVSQRGKELLERIDNFENASASELKEKNRVENEAKKPTLIEIPLPEIQSKLSKMFEHYFWSTLHEKCLGCAVCTYTCPTCHCFDSLDEPVSNSKGQRVRNWDSCMFPLFTLHTSGHNPRPTGKERLRQRIMHKFDYFPERYGEVACVGCGRCIQNCPVNLDLRRILADIAAFYRSDK